MGKLTTDVQLFMSLEVCELTKKMWERYEYLWGAYAGIGDERHFQYTKAQGRRTDPSQLL